MKPKKKTKIRSKLKEEPRSMNSIVLLIGRRLVAAVEREMKAIDDEINARTKV